MLSIRTKPKTKHVSPQVVPAAPEAFATPEKDSFANIAPDLEDQLKAKIAKRYSQEPEGTTAYYRYVFSYQGKGNHAADSHTFASYVKVTPDGKQSWSTISWLPADFDSTRYIPVFADPAEAAWREVLNQHYPPVPGKNFGELGDTLRFGRDGGRHLKKKFSPISPEEYDLALARINYLDTSGILYQADDRGSRMTNVAVNCIHAVSDQVPGSYMEDPRILGTTWGAWGHNATRFVYAHLKTIPATLKKFNDERKLEEKSQLVNNRD